ncbi:MAG: hypothetical protein MJ135_05935 [Oscillospiraceae bacterium]|nr:hypothetical protein [Oscillospiraceae bacterium]
MTPVFVIISIALFCAMLFNLAAKPKVSRGLIGACSLISGIGGLIVYGIGFSSVLRNGAQVVFHTVYAVCRMYAGVNELSSISSAPLLQNSFVLAVFWLLHLMAFYATASATISALGATALKKLKYWLQRYGRSVIIYGVNDDTVAFGRSLISSGVKNIVFVGSNVDAALDTAINSMGALLRTDASALQPDLSFLKSLGSEKGAPPLAVYALDDAEKNQVYAETLLKALENASVDTKNIELVIRGLDDSVECALSRTADRYGYGDVKLFSDVSLTGRMLMQVMPPCDKMKFNPDGTAAGDFDAVIVGFGETGRSVLRQLVRNAQFCGSHFRVAVFSPEAAVETGYFGSIFEEMLEKYDISFINAGAKSHEFFKYIRTHSSTLKYVAICTSTPQSRTEIFTEVSSYLRHLKCNAAVCRCNKKSITWCATPGSPVSVKNIYSADVLGSASVDRLAAVLNHSYVNDPAVSVESAWEACDFFSRESSRASADFIRAYLKIAGKTEEDVAENGWGELSRELTENLGRTEHLRWCAFHYSMGFAPMKEETLRKRGERYLAEVKANGSSRIRISKDLESRLHGCLCEWEELEKLSELECEYTGFKNDYKDMDIRNVLALPAVLHAAKE